MTSRVLIERDVAVPMADGTRLRADVWRPDGPGRYPVLLQRTPYDKRFWLMAHAPIDPARAVEAGYAVVIQDVRGRFASGGVFEPFRQELGDGADSVAWAAAQPWSDGWVGMYGASYVGATQLLAAARRPPALGAIAPALTGSEYYEGWTYQGGAFQLGFALMWARSLAAGELDRREAAGGPRPDLRELLGRDLADPWGSYLRLPVSDQPFLRELAPWFGDWLGHPARDAYWRESAITDHHDGIAVPALHLGGWNDIFVSGTIANYRGLVASGAPGQRLILGPWAHGLMGEMIGDVSYGPDASRWLLDTTDLQIEFFARVRAGDPAPSARVFVLGANVWRDEEEWPPPGTAEQRLYLSGPDRLAWEAPPDGDEPSTYVYDPRDPVSTAGGQTLMPGHEISIMLGQRDQAEIEARPDVLVFTSEPLSEPLELAGRVRLVLHAASSAPDTDWTARLVDVDREGRTLGVVDGILRARFRNGLDREDLLEPGRPYTFEIEVGDTAVVIAGGHRVRLQISSSNFPRFDRNPNTGGSPAEATEADLRPARQTVFHDAGRPSFLVLPVVPRRLPEPNH